MTVRQEWIDLVEIARFPQVLLRGDQQLTTVQRAKWAVEEIQRLKRKANRLITDRMFPGKLTDNDLTKEVIE